MKRKIIVAQVVLFISLLFLSGRSEANAEQIPLPVSTPEIIDRVEYWNTHPEEDPRPLLGEVFAAAKVADAVCPNESDEVKAAIIQCVYNRSLAVGFPDTIEGVANQPCQWEGLTANTWPSERTKKLAKELITQWKNGEGYIIPLDCVYMIKGDDGLYFRSLWNGETESIILYEK